MDVTNSWYIIYHIIMKKLIISFCILLILAAVLFFIGWVQYLVPSGSYGVLSSKTGGVDKRVVQAGEFRWAWERLIPGNAELILFTPKNTETKASISGKLPSAELYAPLIDPSIDFSYQADVAVSYTIKSNALTSLVADEGIRDQEGLDTWLAKKALEIQAFVDGKLLGYAKGADRAASVNDWLRLSDTLQAELEKAFPLLQNLSCTIESARFPDFTLYAEARQLYTDYLERRRSLIAATLAANAEKSARERLRFEELERYAELLEKHPLLIKYLAIEAVAKQETSSAAGAVASGTAALLNVLGQ
ncbi:hypothetical protein MASR2M78_15910 [Treponema sp.]